MRPICPRPMTCFIFTALLIQAQSSLQAQETFLPVQAQSATASPPQADCLAPCEQPSTLRVKFTPYFWLTQMHGDLGLRQGTGEVDLSMGKMWDLVTHDLDFAFLGQLEANYGSFGFLANGVYFQLAPGREIRNLDFGARTSQTALDLDFTYDLLGNTTQSCGCPRTRLEVLAGVRYYSLTGDITLTGPRGNDVNVGGARDWTDLVVGTRATVPLSDAWTAQARGDVGGFGINGCSRMSWNVELTAIYHYSDRVDLVAGYRWLDVNYRRGSGADRFVYDMQTDGPLVGLTFKF